MSILWIPVIVTILILKGHAGLSQATKEAPIHTWKKCVQDESRNIECQEFKTGRTDMISLWPPGPYVIPMTRYGCPESAMHGWREGYITISWQEPQSVHLDINTTDVAFTNMLDSLTSEPFFSNSKRHFVLFPTSKNNIRLNFCYKHRRNASVDIGSWPDENYSILGAEGICPPDFVDYYSNISLPNISQWDSDGYLPDFKIYKVGAKDTLQITLCSRRKSSNISSFADNTTPDKAENLVATVESSFYRNWTYFVLIKNDNASCPTLQNTYVFKETVYIEQQTNIETYVMKVFDSLCYYELKEDEDNWLFETRRKNAYSVHIARITEGNITVRISQSSYFDYFWNELVLFKVKIVHFWKVFDLGRTIPVSAVDITEPRKFPRKLVCNSRYFGCFISREKWNFLYSEAVSCFYVPYCLSGWSTALVFKRIMEGRYVTVFHEEEIGITEEVIASFVYTLTVFTEMIDYDGSDSCNVDLGMQDMNIEDEQISASSWLPGFYPQQSRLYSSGWCPQIDDRQPYLKIVFPMATKIEGITVYNSREVFLIDDLEIFVSFGGSSLTLTYSDDFNTTIHVKALRTDPLKLEREAHTFWLLKSIRAKVVKLTMQKELSFDLVCMRFELHGCMPNEKIKPVTIFNRQRQSPPYEIMAFTSEMNTSESILTNIDYPKYYQSSESYKWIVRFPEFHFIKLVFTHVNFTSRKDIPFKGATVCNDSLTISKDLVNVSPETTRVIDHRFNVTYSLSVETKETLIVLSFLSCFVSSAINRGNGFRAIATYQDIPTCFSIVPTLAHWYQGSQETCRYPSMFITSMSYLGLPFVNTTEEWTIHVPYRRIHLRFLQFNVPCDSFVLNPTFKIIDMAVERSYCNINRPRDSLNSSFDRLTVRFIKRYFDYNAITFLEGFRLLYSIIEEPESRFLDRSETIPETRNIAFYKPAHVPYWCGKDRHAENAVDGLTFPDVQYSTHGSCYTTMCTDSLAWWLVDLQDLYTLDYIVLYGAEKMIEKFAEIDYNCLITLSAGSTIYGMQRTGYFCGQIGRGRVVSQRGIKARYVRLVQHCNGVYLCEVQVYGKLASALTDSATEEPVPVFPEVYGEWGLWSGWTDVCFCDGKQYRHRFCDDPKPAYMGRYCPGENVSYRRCEVVTTPCQVYNGSLITEQDICKENMTGHKGFSSWSDWSPCSSDCGHGLMSRTRKCISDNSENGKYCVGDLSEDSPCIGNGKCLICSNTFAKCYRIITKYTNWQQARLECLRRNMTLVSILSLPEMRFVKYLLRQKRSIDGLPFNYFNADFYVHIGLLLAVSSTDRVRVWENGYYPTYFTAWKKDEPSTERHCTRMNFKLFDDDNTWESEDCKHQLAEYIMCEYQEQRARVSAVKSLKIWIDFEEEKIPAQIPAREYNGSMNVTVTGKSCIESLCRDINDVGYVHCKNADGYYEECNVKLPPLKNSSVVNYKYLGKLNTTFSGKICQRWDTAIVMKANELHGDMFQGEGISDAANYCRDIGEAGFLWCLTLNLDAYWEPCLLNEIKTERKCTTQLEYTGTKNTTITGKTCLRWDKQKQNLKGSVISELNLTNAENYCRDPFNIGYSWCYVYSPNQGLMLEPCHVEAAETITQASESSFITSYDEPFICSNGEEIPDYLSCDGKFDCEDKSDETECLNVYNIHAMIKPHINTNSTFLGTGDGSFFGCMSGEWISIIAKCDRVIDCLDASDETDCDFNNLGKPECTHEQFRCDDGDCIHISQVCNHVDDCIDASDEYCDFDDCILLTEYHCRNGQCIPLAQRCDAIKQCPDGSDETECDECQPNAFHCDVAVCIPMRLRCDSFEHCEDKTDEISCEAGDFYSCQDVWTAGFRTSGHYTVGDAEIYCQFNDVLEKGKIKTVIQYDFEHSVTFFFFLKLIEETFYNIPLTKAESRYDFLIFEDYEGSCIQQVVEICLPTYEAVEHSINTSVCYCGVLNFEIRRIRQKHPTSIEACPATSYKNWTLPSESSVPRNRFLYMQLERNRDISIIGREPFHQLLPGPAICVHDFTPADNDFVCNIKGKHIPLSQRCVYDIDASGFPTGCTDGSHLLNCESYDCPRNTLKCPESYCIPQRFLCDGVVHCPKGEDEDNCGCEPTRNEILIIYDAVSVDGPNIVQFARQFYTQTNVVRVLSYKATKPLTAFGIKDILLEVHDTEINRSPEIETAFDCHYKLFARNFLDSVHFTNEGTKGVIVIQNSEISKEIFRSIVIKRSFMKPDVRIYRVSRYSDTFLSTENKTLILSHFTDIRIRRWRNLNGIGAEYFSKLCKIATKVQCPNGYKCLSSKFCIPVEQICDGRIQCLHGDDEVLCEFQCPVNCTCSGYFASCSATTFDQSMLFTISKPTRHLDISLNRNLGSVLQDTMLTLTTLSVLNVSGCNIQTVSQYAFVGLRNLRTLDLSFNSISNLSNFVFASLLRLTSLNLRGNSELSIIETHAFDGLSLIQDLDLANAKLSKISADTFVGLKLTTINLANNKLQEIENYAFRDSYVENLNFEGNNIKHFNKEIFTGLIGLKILKTPAFKFCCIRPNYVSEPDCYPHKDEFSSCDDLMRHSGLQFLIWLIGVLALLGNVLSIVYRIKYDRERLKLGFGIFVTNLAVADFLMAIYLLIIAIADSAFRKRYIYVDDYWRHSVWCNIAGVLSTTSSEASVLFLCLITLDRLLVIKFPFGGAKITTHKAIACVVCAWIFSLFIALLPIAYEGYFKNEFYSKSGVCIALPLTRDRPSGWAYSLAVFICLNFITFILVAVGQLSIFVEIRKSTGIATSTALTRKRDLKVARNLLLVVTTDFLCWFPIGVMGMLALTGHPVSGEVYAWAAVFILPVNSALNPPLYTLSAIIGAKSFSPSTDEQSFAKLTKDIGENSVKCMMASHYLYSKRIVSTFQDIGTISTAKVDMSSKMIAKVAAKLAFSMNALHRSSLGIRPLEEKSVLVGIRGGKLTGNIKVKGEPFISYKPEDKQNDIYKLGMILKSLIAAKKKRKE